MLLLGLPLLLSAFHLILYVVIMIYKFFLISFTAQLNKLASLSINLYVNCNLESSRTLAHEHDNWSWFESVNK